MLTVLLQSPCLSSGDVDIAKSEITEKCSQKYFVNLLICIYCAKIIASSIQKMCRYESKVVDIIFFVLTEVVGKFSVKSLLMV